jgi:hypothetical protein
MRHTRNLEVIHCTDAEAEAAADLEAGVEREAEARLAEEEEGAAGAGEEEGESEPPVLVEARFAHSSVLSVGSMGMGFYAPTLL